MVILKEMEKNCFSLKDGLVLIEIKIKVSKYVLSNYFMHLIC